MYAVLGGLVFAIGAWAVYYGFTTRADFRKSDGWQPAAGRILESRVQIANQRWKTQYYPVIEYEYSVGAANYRGRRWTFSKPAGTKDSAQAVVDRYAVGKTVTVYYDPKDPSSSVIERTFEGLWAMWTVGGVFLLAGFLMMAYWALTTLA